MNGFRAFRSSSVLALTLLSFALRSFPAHAETSHGARVRIRQTSGPREIGGRTLPGTRITTGLLVSSTSDTVMVLTDAGDTRAIPTASITSTERQSGTRRHTLLGAVIGAPIGALVGWGIASATNEFEADMFSATLGLAETSSFEDEGRWVLAGAGIGAGLGAICGYLSKSEGWQPMPTSDLQMHAAVSSDGATSVSLTLRF